MTADVKASRPPNSVLGDRYRIDGRLGEGASSAVYRATHLGTERVVAVKVLHASLLADPVAVKRFMREARATCRVVHPNVVEVLDAGIDDTGRPYLVSELLEGETLAARLAREPGPMPLRQVAELVLPLLDALAVAHEAGIVHRDIKPENVLLHRTRDGRVVPKLVDFGISKRVDSRAAGITLLTLPGTVFGTPHYISPEQALSSSDVDARTDVWSAGVLLYRLLVGRVPFDAPHVGALLGLVFDALPASPGAFGVPPGVSAVVLRCLSKDRAARFPDGRSLKTALCAALGVSAAAGAPSSGALPSLRVAAPCAPVITVRPPYRALPSPPSQLSITRPPPAPCPPAPPAPPAPDPASGAARIVAVVAVAFAGLGMATGGALVYWNLLGR